MFSCFFIHTPYPIHGIHEMWVSFILQKGLMKMLLLKLIGYAFGILILVAIVCMIAAIIMATFDESKHDRIKN